MCLVFLRIEDHLLIIRINSLLRERNRRIYDSEYWFKSQISISDA